MLQYSHQPKGGALVSAGIYIHIPFCKRKCPYCDFYSVVADDSLRRDYARALIKRIATHANKSLSVDTIYFGGGTPSLMHSDDIADIIRAVKASFNVSDNCEITLECNPSSVDFDKLCAFKSAGVNRLSFGVQSSDDDELKALGRLHDFSLAQRAVLDSQLAGFENISCDLMIGTPHQTIESLTRSVRALCSLNIKHISCYMLKIEEGTAYDCDQIRASVADDDAVSDMYLALCEELERLGFMQYEISNFAIGGYESCHNLKYWIGEDYIGFGPAAHSYYNNRRTYAESDVYAFIANPLSKDLIEDDSPDKLLEYIMLGLRISKGISLEKINLLGGDSPAFLKALKPFVSAQYAILDGDNVSLTREGYLRSNGIISRLLESQISQNE